MGKLKQLKEMLKDLSPEEVDQIKAFLNGEVEDTTNEPETTEKPVDEVESAETEKTKSEEVSESDGVVEESTKTEEGASSEESSDETTLDESTPEDESESETTETVEETKSQDESVENVEETEKVASEEQNSAESEQKTESEQPSNGEDDDLVMRKLDDSITDEVVENSAEVPNLTDDETGKELPVDYEQIIAGLNAKNAALEAEIKQLRAKVNGAFGLSSKAPMPGKVNHLYDEAADELKLHK